MTFAVVLLAAGRSSRFGGPKLMAKLGGKPLAWHSAATVARLPLAGRIAVTGPDTPDLSAFGFDCIALDPPGAPQSQSVRLGVERALAVGATQVLVALADMPLVPLSHFQALIAAFDGTGVATSAKDTAMPPALFGPALIPALTGLAGDQGARGLLHDLPTIELALELALDIDTPDDLKRAERLLAKL